MQYYLLHDQIKIHGVYSTIGLAYECHAIMPKAPLRCALTAITVPEKQRPQDQIIARNKAVYEFSDEHKQRLRHELHRSLHDPDYFIVDD